MARASPLSTTADVYSMALDGNKPRFIDGNGPDLFEQSLFHVQNLENGPHKLVIQDASQVTDPDLSFFDIDYVCTFSLTVRCVH